ncbi:unnamed protein product [Rhizophagus irregularis]|nr:unnamed protein product [Rhizophagus irregularis]
MGSDISDDTKELKKHPNNTHSLQSSKKPCTIPSPVEKDDELPYIPLKIDWFSNLSYTFLQPIDNLHLAVENDMMDSSSAGPFSY